MIEAMEAMGKLFYKILIDKQMTRGSLLAGSIRIHSGGCMSGHRPPRAPYGKSFNSIHHCDSLVSIFDRDVMSCSASGLRPCEFQFQVMRNLLARCFSSTASLGSASGQRPQCK
jgi:hypothetical protein